jgi:hypothetical protein
MRYTGGNTSLPTVTPSEGVILPLGKTTTAPAGGCSPSIMGNNDLSGEDIMEIDRVNALGISAACGSS